MKADVKFLISAAAAVAMTAAGCSVSDIAGLPPDTDIDGVYSAECSITAEFDSLDDTADSESCVFTGVLRRLGGGFWEMDITSPETIAGLHVSADDTSITSSLGDLSFDNGLSDIPEKSPLKCVFASLDSAAASSEELQRCDEGWSMSGTAGNSDYTVIFGEDGVPLSLSCDTYGVRVDFISFTISG